MELQKTKLVFNKKIPLNFSAAQFKANLQEKMAQKAVEQKEILNTKVQAHKSIQKSKEQIKQSPKIDNAKENLKKPKEQPVVTQANKPAEVKPTLSKDQLIQYRHTLQKVFPKAFPNNDYVPLYKGIRVPIRKALNIPYKEVVQFIRWYITRKGYLAKYKVGTWRVDIDGNNAEQITQEIYDLKAKGLNPKKLPLLTAENKSKAL